MSLHPRTSYDVPAETVRVAHACFPKGHPYLRLSDTLGPIFHDEDFAALSPTRGQPAAAPGRLALVTLLQFAENPSDRQAANAVCSRIDWKYLLGLERLHSSPNPRWALGVVQARILDTASYEA